MKPSLKPMLVSAALALLLSACASPPPPPPPIAPKPLERTCDTHEDTDVSGNMTAEGQTTRTTTRTVCVTQ
ncbi:hypothetical protein RG836_02410 [Pseudomonas sp. SZMC_28357]|uniref:hypothetical protein n=1 Tax=Pseudomonas sp. SZMC_28357 TaxID=3074380 RepID=UPI0028716767|nr:hypothetical protein [Pseudomonas sp. SZMC_28357]MDR9750286.1 hypothetical protein [Pseudomonas sp. SZMC_28357]